MNAGQYPRINISEDDAREIERVYDDFLGMLKELSGKATEVVRKTIVNIIDEIIKTLSSRGGESLLLYTSKIFDKDYIFAHSLNICLISIRMGLRLGFDKERLKNLGFSALAHARKDMGFAEELLKGIEHNKELDEVIRLADIYDALTHPPAYRHTMTPFETLTSVINTDKFFDRRLTKILLEELSLYPKGSWVQLSTKEIGRVVKVNKEGLLRPTVKLFIDGQGEHLREKRTVDLSRIPAIYVLRPLTEEEVKNIRES